MTAALILTAAVVVMLHHATPTPLVLVAFLVAVAATGHLCWWLDTKNGDLT